MNKKSWILVIALALVVAILAAAYFVTRPDPETGKKTFTLTVIHKDGSQKDFNLKSDELYLGDCLQKKGIISGEEGQYGLYIQVVDGEKAVFEEDGAYWAFYEGNNYALQGIDQTPIITGVNYKLVYTVDVSG